MKGRWISIRDKGKTGDITNNQEFIPEPTGDELAVKVGARRGSSTKPKKVKQGLQVLMSNDSNNLDSPTFTKHDDPVSDRDLVSKGIIWINAVHPIIERYGNDKEKEDVRNENIANFVLMIVAQYHAQKEAELQPEDERDDPLLLFRKHFFSLQREIRDDKEIDYYQEKN